MYGIYIRGQTIMNLILNCDKLMETRTHNKLKKFIGHEVGLILTGCGKPRLVGYATIMDCHQFHDLDEFRLYECLHRIQKGSKYDWDLKTQKYGYLLGEVKKLDSPILLKSVCGNRMYRKLDD